MLSRQGCKKQQTQQTCLCYFFLRMVLIFGKATHITMKALVLVASLVSSISTNDDITYKISTTARYFQCYQHQCNLLLISTSATNASAISNSAVSTGAISTCAMGHWRY